jgi:hypothetical protein
MRIDQLLQPRDCQKLTLAIVSPHSSQVDQHWASTRMENLTNRTVVHEFVPKVGKQFVKVCKRKSTP